MAKTKVVKAKVMKPKVKHKTKRFQSWEVWDIYKGIPQHCADYSSLARAEKCVQTSKDLVAAFIVYVDVPPVEY